MNRSKRILCALAVCALAWSALAEDATVENTPVPSETEVPPTAEPTVEPTLEPTFEPTAEPTIIPSPEPITRIEIIVEGMETVEDVCQIALQSPGDPIVFQWQPVEGADAYRVQIADAQENVIAESVETDGIFSLPTQELGAEVYLLTVQACAGTELLMSGELWFVLVQSAREPGRGGSGGGFSGGSGGFSGGKPSGAPSSGAPSGESQSFRVTPGEALTSSHASGDRDMQLYGAVEVAAAEEPMEVLTLGGVELAVSLDGQARFFAVAEGDCLTLTPEAEGEAWRVNAFALKTLNRSGVDLLRLRIGDGAVEIPTDWSPQGAEYARLCAEGYVSKDYELRVALSGVEVLVAGECYRLNQDNELVGG